MSNRIRPQCDLSVAVSEWLRNQGCDVYAEVPWPGETSARRIDLVGRRSDSPHIAVELSQRIYWLPLQQCAQLKRATPLVWCVTWIAPRSSTNIMFAVKHGFGLAVVERDRVLEIVQPDDQSRIDDATPISSFRDDQRNQVGGLHGYRRPATFLIDVLRKFEYFKEQNPTATICEAWQRINNPYRSQFSFGQALGKARRLLAQAG